MTKIVLNYIITSSRCKIFWHYEFKNWHWKSLWKEVSIHGHMTVLLYRGLLRMLIHIWSKRKNMFFFLPRQYFKYFLLLTVWIYDRYTTWNHFAHRYSSNIKYEIMVILCERGCWCSHMTLCLYRFHEVCSNSKR